MSPSCAGDFSLAPATTYLLWRRRFAYQFDRDFVRRSGEVGVQIEERNGEQKASREQRGGRFPGVETREERRRAAACGARASENPPPAAAAGFWLRA